jgi:hypothetical protein
MERSDPQGTAPPGFIVAIGRANRAIGDEKQERDMERDYQIEATE